jgi:hypothetical protein
MTETRGTSRAPRRLIADAAAPEFEVAVAVDAPRFVAFLMERLLRLS